MPAQNNETSLGLERNLVAALAYVLGPFTGLFFLIMEKDSYVRFHSMQSIMVLGGLIALYWGFKLTVFLAPLTQFVALIYFVLFLVLIFKAWNGERFLVPVIDRFTRRTLSRL